MENPTDTSPIYRRLEGLEEVCAQIITNMEEELTSLVEAYRAKGTHTASLVEALSRFPKKLNAYKGGIHHELFLLKIGAHPEYGDGKNIDADRASRQIQPELIKDFRAHIGNAREELKEATKNFVNDWCKYHGVMFLQDSGLKTKLRSEKIDERLEDYMGDAGFLSQRDWDSFIAEGLTPPFLPLKVETRQPNRQKPPALSPPQPHRATTPANP